MFGRIFQGATDTAQGLRGPLAFLATLPLKTLGYVYHKGIELILTGPYVGLSNFVNDSVKPVIHEIANTHARSASGEEIPEEEWERLYKQADLIVSANVSGAVKEPINNLMRLSTKDGSIIALKSAADTLVVILAMICSQSGKSAAVSTLLAIMPGGQFTKEALRKILYEMILKVGAEAKEKK